jgi:hypothetical protein
MSEQDQAPLRCEFDSDKLVIKLDEVVLSDVTVIDGTVAKIMGLIKQSDGCEDAQKIDLALREALANAIVHGNQANTVRTVLIFRGIWSSVETSKTISVGKWLRSIERRGFAQAKTITSSH